MNDAITPEEIQAGLLISLAAHGQRRRKHRRN